LTSLSKMLENQYNCLASY